MSVEKTVRVRFPWGEVKEIEAVLGRPAARPGALPGWQPSANFEWDFLPVVAPDCEFLALHVTRQS